jgi:coenzyme F420-reducing hydrogenase alpha subunit
MATKNISKKPKDKLESLLSKQEGFAKELMNLYKEINVLKKGGLPFPNFSIFER